MKNTVIDLFCGVGGFSKGFEMSGKFDIINGYDMNEKFLDTYNYNLKGEGIKYNIKNKIPKNLKKVNIDVIIGSVPYHNFTISNKRNYQESNKNDLLLNFIRWVNEIQPKIAIMETTSKLLTIHNDDLINKIKKEYKKIGYNIIHFVLNFKDLSMPQNKKRLIIIAFKNDLTKVEFYFQQIINKNHLENKYINIGEAISDLPISANGDIVDYKCDPQNNYQKILRKKSKKIYNHIAKKLSNEDISIIKNNYKNKRNNKFEKLNEKNLSTPITSYDFITLKKIHPSEHRTISLREGARIQGFPDDFIFRGSFNSIAKQIGYATSPVMAKEIAQYIYDIFFSNNRKSRYNCDWSTLSATEFENLCQEYLESIGLENVRKIGKTNASDGGRDIQATEFYPTVIKRYEKRDWIFQCKNSKRSINKKELADIPNIVKEFNVEGYGLFVSGELAPSAIDRLNNYKEEFEVIWWTGNDLERKLDSDHPEILSKYGLR